MKKYAVILFLLIGMIMLTGCTKKSSPIEDIANIKITVDEESVQKTQEALDAFKGK